MSVADLKLFFFYPLPTHNLIFDLVPLPALASLANPPPQEKNLPPFRNLVPAHVLAGLCWGGNERRSNTGMQLHVKEGDLEGDFGE